MVGCKIIFVLKNLFFLITFLVIQDEFLAKKKKRHILMIFLDKKLIRLE